jgi:phospholipid/cholesterol/gamma-HCH transport system substrate-binding protein
MRNETVETLIGAIVVAIAVIFVVYTYRTTGTANVGGYELVTKMDRVDGIAVGTDVKLAGVKVGTVSALTLDYKDYRVTVHMAVQSDVKVPDDSSVIVTSAGLLGSSYISIQPGGSDKVLPPGGLIKNSQGALDMMGLINRFVGSNNNGNSNGNTNPAPAPAQP